MDPKCTHRHPGKREAEEALISGERKERKIMCGWEQRRGI